MYPYTYTGYKVRFYIVFTETKLYTRQRVDKNARTHLFHLYVEVGVDGAHLAQEALVLEAIIEPRVVLVVELAAQLDAQLRGADQLLQLVDGQQLRLKQRPQTR